MSDPGGAPARLEKSAAAFRTIGEAADDLDVPPHVLRFWETKFPQLKPLKRGGGRRYYRPEDILLLRRIRQCLYDEGYTIRGVQKLLEEGRAANGEEPQAARCLAATAADAPAAVPPAEPDVRDPAIRATLEEIRRELLEARALLGELVRRPKPF